MERKNLERAVYRAAQEHDVVVERIGGGFSLLTRAGHHLFINSERFDWEGPWLAAKRIRNTIEFHYYVTFRDPV